MRHLNCRRSPYHHAADGKRRCVFSIRPRSNSFANGRKDPTRCLKTGDSARHASGTNTAVAVATNISEIRVKVNGRVQRTMSGTLLRDLNLLNTTHSGTASQVWFDCTGVPKTAPGVSFPIFFAEPWCADARDRDALAWPSNGWQSFQIEVGLGAASTHTTTLPASRRSHAKKPTSADCSRTCWKIAAQSVWPA